MNPWSRLNLLLAVLVAGLFAATQWPGETDDRPRLTQIIPDSIDTIRIERGGRLRLQLKREAARWQMTYPQQSPAPHHRVQQLLAVSRAPVIQSFTAEPPLGRYGLDAPAATIQFNDTRLVFGGSDISGRNRYVMAEQRIHLVDSLFFNLLTLPPRHFTED